MIAASFVTRFPLPLLQITRSRSRLLINKEFELELLDIGKPELDLELKEL